jgi:hypothetical protein
MAVSRETTRTTVAIVLDSSGRVAGASKPHDYHPAKEGDERVVTVGLAAEPGQSVVEVEVPADVANLDGQELLRHLADQPSVRAVIASTPTAGQANWGSLQATAAVPFDVSQQGPGGVSAGQGAGPVSQSSTPLGIGVTNVITAGPLG